MPKIVDHDVRRTEFAAAACEAIFQKGIDALKLTDVAEFAGCTTGALTHYFDSKDALIIAAIDHAWDSVRTRMYEQLEADEIDALAFFSELLPTTREKQKANTVWFHYWLRSMHSPELAQKKDDNHIEWLAMMAACFEKLKKQGCIKGEVVDLDLETIDAVMHGISLHGVIAPDRWPAERQVAQLEHYLNSILN